MRYTDSEERKIKEINSKIALLDTESLKAQKQSDAYKKRIDKWKNEISKKKDRLYSSITKIDNKVKKRCKHKGGTTLRYNPRDDVDYTHRVICDDCGEQTGYYGKQTPYG